MPDGPSRPDALVTVARADSVAGEVALRRRTTAAGAVVHELIVNGAFAMDTVEVASEVRLADLAVDAGARTVLVGGLGLGFTAARLAAGGVDRIDVVELAEPLVRWARAGLAPSLVQLAAYPQIRLHVADVRDVLTGAREIGPTAWDAVLLDVDNGPDFLIHDPNADLYRPALLSAAWHRLNPGGVLLIWCQGRSADLEVALAGLGPVVEHLVPVERDGRTITYALYALTRSGQTGDDAVGSVDQNVGHD